MRRSTDSSHPGFRVTVAVAVIFAAAACADEPRERSGGGAFPSHGLRPGHHALGD